MTQKTQKTQKTQMDLGNTRPNPTCKLSSKRSRRWCLTINNYNEKILKDFDTKTHYFEKYICGKEGDEKTPHLQIYVETKNATKFERIKKLFPTAHIEPAKGNRKHNYDYCSKEGDFKTNIDFLTFREKLKIELLAEQYKETKWKPFQEKIHDILSKKPDKRKVHWFWESTGNIGKSFICKYIALKYKGVVICEGKKGDIFNQVNILLDTKIEPKIILLDIPRTSQDFINYGVLEQLKNGMVYSGKYEGGQCLFRTPIVICFSNEEPKKETMSLDRWDIHKIV